MNPTYHTPGAPHLRGTYSSEAIPNPLYSMHVNAAVAGPSTQRPHPRSNSSPTSFYPSHLAQVTRIPPPPIPSKPSSPTSPLPPSLMPGGSGHSRPGVLSSFESSLFFQSPTTSLVMSSNLPAVSQAHPYARILPSASRAPIPQKPPVPSDHRVSTPPEMSPVSVDEDEMVARALELSLKESTSISNSDLENDLARVLEESLSSISSSAGRCTRAAQDTPVPRQLEIDKTPEVLSSSYSPSCSSHSLAATPTTVSNSHAAVAYNGEQTELQNLSADPDLEQLTKREEELLRAKHEARQKQVEADEGFARTLALLEAESASISSDHSPVSGDVNSTCSLSSSSSSGVPKLLYNASSSAARPASFHVGSLPTQSRSITTYFSASPPSIVTDARPLQYTVTPSSDRSRTASASTGAEVVFPHLTRSVSAQASLPSATGLSPGGSPNDSHPYSVIPVQHVNDSAGSDTSSSSPTVSAGIRREGMGHTLAAVEGIGPAPSEEAEDNELFSPTDEPEEGRLVSHSSPSSPPLVEEELLSGVSIGFNAPSLSSANEPMQIPIPNIIALPCGRCPPLHIQAPSWKHLLKLMARLSDSRIEPTVDALAGTKTELKLRTVIQFMKVHHLSDEWRTIVYLTIDVPVPPSSPNIFKYTNGDVNTFPYSYTTSPLPALLRAGAGDSSLSKCFTVPATAHTPHPTLPMTLPDFALYLHSVLEDSRRAANDSSGGLRKLAKMVDTIYPASTPEGLGPELDVPGRKGVGKFFRRLGRGSKDSQNQRGGNAERYEFITPFRIDEYR